MKPVNPDYIYVQKIGTLMNSTQFGKMQKLLQPLNESERMEILYNQLKLEKEAELTEEDS